MFGTHCKGTRVACYPEKIEFCKGCEIIERLIINEYEHEPDRSESAAAPALPGVSAKEKVLAIDDNPEVIELIKKHLGGEYEVIGLGSGEQAVQAARDLQPLAILLDIMMPRKSGWQVLQELKRTPDTQDIPVIILSIVDEKRLGFSLGAAEYLVKPIERHVLLRKLQNLQRLGPIRRVLVVDTDRRAVSLIKHVLAEENYRATVAYNDDDGIKAIRNARPDLVVVGLTHDLGGFGVIELIKTEERLKSIPLIVITYKDMSETEIRDLNGRIEAIFSSGRFTEADLATELRKLGARYGKHKPGARATAQLRAGLEGESE
jgi:DNA-binding response OmpR family regulator